ncbi:uncharacterized protein LOC122400478 [Colletes gigas]|uniref:uncharacterized protein LOC122400478 n=1 Tax=Colletes gigas TaxID=935657 RepID=UPI001C9B843A|nr:uncharacterized protein LOC122400478 [Colletes gigas]
MEFFKSFLRVIGLLQPAKVDFISELPLEVSQLILRKLDPESLLSVAQVSSKWLNVCSSDKRLRQTARRYQRRNRKEMRRAFLGELSTAQWRLDVPRKLPETKMMLRNVPRARVEVAVVFGRAQRLRNLPTRGEVRSNVRIRSNGCIRM